MAAREGVAQSVLGTSTSEARARNARKASLI
jgi:hypothetical protein